MKVLYVADDRYGAGLIASDFVKHCKHTVKVAGYLKHKPYLKSIDYLLDNIKDKTLIKQGIERFAPDVAVIDADFKLVKILSQLKIPMVYCSPLQLLMGCHWDEYSDYRYGLVSRQNYYLLKRFPKGIINLVYSPFGDFSKPSRLNPEYEWVTPYPSNKKYSEPYILKCEDPIRFEILESIIKRLPPPNQQIMFSSGETSHIMDAIHNGVPIIFIPNVKEPEATINSNTCAFRFGCKDLGQIEYYESFVFDKLEQVLKNKFRPLEPTKQKHKLLHEKIEELW